MKLHWHNGREREKGRRTGAAICAWFREKGLLKPVVMKPTPRKKREKGRSTAALVGRWLTAVCRLQIAASDPSLPLFCRVAWQACVTHRASQSASHIHALLSLSLFIKYTIPIFVTAASIDFGLTANTRPYRTTSTSARAFDKVSALVYTRPSLSCQSPPLSFQLLPACLRLHSSRPKEHPIVCAR